MFERIQTSFERIQTGLATDHPALPQGCWMDQNLRSDWQVAEPETRPLYGLERSTESVQVRRCCGGK